MATISDLLLLGDPRLYEQCTPVQYEERNQIASWVSDLDDVMTEIQNKYGFGRGIAAPQLGIMKRLVYIRTDKPWVLINPEIIETSEDTFDLWDDCMSFPALLVHVQRYSQIKIRYTDLEWQHHEMVLKNDLSELLQHEIDHLDGILCTMRAINQKSFRWKPIT